MKKGPGPGPFLLAAVVFLLAASLLLSPKTVVVASTAGAKLWWEVVFPSLLPFFICAKLLMALGVVQFLGVLVEGLMRPLFAIPGPGAFVMLMGFGSSYPMASILASDLLRRGECTTAEAERMVTYFTTADPLFLSGAVAVGMLSRPDLAPVLISSHYLAALAIALIAARLAPAAARAWREAPWPSLGRAGAALLESRRRDGRPFGKVLGDAVQESVNTLLIIGGLIMLFSVLAAILDQVGLFSPLARLAGAAVAPLGMPAATGRAVAMGLFEVTIGARAAAALTIPLDLQMMAIAFIMAWGGFSIHAQVASIVQGTGIRLGPVLWARAAQAALAALLARWLLASPVAVAILSKVVAPPRGLAALGALGSGSVRAGGGLPDTGAGAWLSPFLGNLAGSLWATMEMGLLWLVLVGLCLAVAGRRPRATR